MTFEDDTADNTGYHAMRPIGCTSGSHHRCAQAKKTAAVTNEKIREIAEKLDCGLVCFYHRPTGNIDCHPDPNDPYFDLDPWHELIDKIESDWDNYDRFEKMDSTESFQVIIDFAHSLTDLSFKEEILERLARRKPFQNFKNLIDSSDYRQNWFDFKKRAYTDFVKEQIELNE